MMKLFVLYISILLAVESYLEHALAANITSGMIVYTENASCPTGYTEIATNKRGVAILADPGSSYGNVVGTPYKIATARTHTHTLASICISQTIPNNTTYKGTGTRRSMVDADADTLCDYNRSRITTDASSGYAFAFLRACVATASATGQVPVNTVAHFDSTVSTCPSGWTRFTNANGRFIVPLSATQQSSSTTVTSTSSAMTVSSSSSTVGAHTHSLSTTYTFSGAPFEACCALTLHTTHSEVGDTAWPVTGSTASTNALQQEVPWVGLLTCIATTGVTNSGDQRPPQGSIVYMASSSCAQGYERIDSKYDGRIILTNPTGQTSATTFGGTVLTPPNGITHTHSVSGVTLKVGSYLSSADSSSGTSKLYKLGSEYLAVATFTSATGDAALPYIAVSLCRPKLPTAAPTQSPTNHPTTSPVKIPTKPPIRSPTRDPTKLLTNAPTEISTMFPTIPTSIKASSGSQNSPTFTALYVVFPTVFGCVLIAGVYYKFYFKAKEDEQLIARPI